MASLTVALVLVKVSIGITTGYEYLSVLSCLAISTCGWLSWRPWHGNEGCSWCFQLWNGLFALFWVYGTFSVYKSVKTLGKYDSCEDVGYCKCCDSDDCGYLHGGMIEATDCSLERAQAMSILTMLLVVGLLTAHLCACAQQNQLHNYIEDFSHSSYGRQMDEADSGATISGVPNPVLAQPVTAASTSAGQEAVATAAQPNQPAARLDPKVGGTSTCL